MSLASGLAIERKTLQQQIEALVLDDVATAEAEHRIGIRWAPAWRRRSPTNRRREHDVGDQLDTRPRSNVGENRFLTRRDSLNEARAVQGMSLDCLEIEDRKPAK